MKKLLMMIGAAAGTVGAYAAEIEINGVTWQYTDRDDTAKTVTLGLGGSGNTAMPTATVLDVANIPWTMTINGETYTVTKVNSYAFKSCNGLTGTLSIPNAVTEVGERAFETCNGLTGLASIGGVTKFGNYVFNTSRDIVCDVSGINLAQVASFGTGVFQHCTNFTGKATLNSSLTSIPGRLFNNTRITIDMIPNGVTSIGEYAFQNTLIPRTLAMPSGLKTIGDAAFAGTPLSGFLALPKSVTGIGASTSASSRLGAFKNTQLTCLFVPGPDTVTSGTQTYTEICVQILLGSDTDGFTSPAKLFFAGHNTKMKGYSTAWRDKMFRSTTGTAFVPLNGYWDGFTGSTGTDVFYYGPATNIDFSVNADAKVITATPTDEAALVKVISEWAPLFKAYCGWNTRINVTNSIEVAAGTITAEMLNSVEFNTMLLTFKVNTQAQLNNVLAAVPASTYPLLAIDASDAREELILPQGREIYVRVSGDGKQGKYRPKINGLIISFF